MLLFCCFAWAFCGCKYVFLSEQNCLTPVALTERCCQHVCSRQVCCHAHETGRHCDTEPHCDTPLFIFFSSEDTLPMERPPAGYVLADPTRPHSNHGPAPRRQNHHHHYNNTDFPPDNNQFDRGRPNQRPPKYRGPPNNNMVPSHYRDRRQPSNYRHQDPRDPRDPRVSNQIGMIDTKLSHQSMIIGMSRRTFMSGRVEPLRPERSQ